MIVVALFITPPDQSNLITLQMKTVQQNTDVK